MPIIFSLIVLVVMVVAIVDIVTRDEGLIRYMPKLVWLLLVILLPLIGSVLWFVLGRERPPRPVRTTSFAPQAPEPTRDTRTTEQQLADLDREIEEERLRQEIVRRRAERDGGGA